MYEVSTFPAPSPIFSYAAITWQLKAPANETAEIKIPIPANIDAGNQLDCRMFVEIFNGNDIEILHGQDLVGSTSSAGDMNGSNTAAHGGQQVTISCPGPCNHFISSFNFYVAPD